MYWYNLRSHKLFLNEDIDYIMICDSACCFIAQICFTQVQENLKIWIDRASMKLRCHGILFLSRLATSEETTTCLNTGFISLVPRLWQAGNEITVLWNFFMVYQKFAHKTPPILLASDLRYFHISAKQIYMMKQLTMSENVSWSISCHKKRQ